MTFSVSSDKLNQFLSFCSNLSWETDACGIANEVIDNISPVLDCERASFFFVYGDTLELVLGQGVENLRVPVGDGLAGECARTNKVISVPCAYEDPRFDKSFDQKTPN